MEREWEKEYFLQEKCAKLKLVLDDRHVEWKEKIGANRLWLHIVFFKRMGVVVL